MQKEDSAIRVVTAGLGASIVLMISFLLYMNLTDKTDASGKMHDAYSVTEICHDGVVYLEYLHHGLTVKYDKNGKVALCQ